MIGVKARAAPAVAVQQAQALPVEVRRALSGEYGVQRLCRRLALCNAAAGCQQDQSCCNSWQHAGQQQGRLLGLATSIAVSAACPLVSVISSLGREGAGGQVASCWALLRAESSWAAKFCQRRDVLLCMSVCQEEADCKV